MTEAIDESGQSEITIQPDGRIYAFGITGPLVAVLAAIPTADLRVNTLLQQLSRLQDESQNSPRACNQENR